MDNLRFLEDPGDVPRVTTSSSNGFHLQHVINLSFVGRRIEFLPIRTINQSSESLKSYMKGRIHVRLL